jgi:hypothetical protein
MTWFEGTASSPHSRRSRESRQTHPTCADVADDGADGPEHRGNVRRLLPGQARQPEVGPVEGGGGLLGQFPARVGDDGEDDAPSAA